MLLVEGQRQIRSANAGRDPPLNPWSSGWAGGSMGWECARAVRGARVMRAASGWLEPRALPRALVHGRVGASGWRRRPRAATGMVDGEKARGGGDLEVSECMPSR